MILYKTIAPLQNKLRQLNKTGKTIGFVPTMGALHDGHLSLINDCASINDITVCSIFVNPTQFNDIKDFEKYPLSVENDILLLELHNTDILFLPSVEEIYPHGLKPSIHYNLGYLENILEGFYRPGHFQGVCQVVHRLLEIIKPTELFLGQKDYQQCLIIKKVTELFYINTKIITCPTLREPDGLALSSRNRRINTEARKKAPALYKALNYIKNNITDKEILILKKNAQAMMLDAGFEKTDYTEVCHAETLQPVLQYDPATPSIVLAAAFIDGVRLIDNLLIN